MLEFIYFIVNKEKFSKNLRRMIVHCVLKYYLPITYLLAFKIYSNNFSKNDNQKTKIIVSLTSFPARIDDLWMTIETLFRQSVKPDIIILWLANGDFKNGVDSLPYMLKQQRKKGLQIKFFDDDLKPHNKYYYTFSEFPNDIVITVDDDVFYHKCLVETLLKLYKKFPECICCNRAYEITFNNEGKMSSYSCWGKCNTFGVPSMSLFPTGVGGVLYPVNSVDKEVFNKESIKKFTLCNDDLWLRMMAIKNNTKVVVAEQFFDFVINIKGSQKEALWKSNVSLYKNDEQLMAILKGYEHLKLEDIVLSSNVNTH